MKSGSESVDFKAHGFPERYDCFMALLDVPSAADFHQKEVLVAGGAGFLGSWLSETLLAHGSSVTCIDNLATGREANISHLRTHKNFRFEKIDISDGIMDRHFDMIFHFASRASPEEYQQHPVETMLANSIGTRNILELAAKYNSRVIYASSSEVYGHPDVVPTPESYWGHVNPIGPRSCYDEGKRFGEALCMAYLRAYNLDVRIVRIFNTYGPRIRGDGAYARAASRFINQALRSEPLTVYGDGSQTRSFCFVTDTINAILRVATSDAARAEVFNIGNPREITILTLAQLVEQLAGGSHGVKYGPLPEDDPPRRCPDISKARSILGWEPRVGLEEGLSQTMRWFRENELPRSNT
jgi:UDP-glucuronate decarboxylase